MDATRSAPPLLATARALEAVVLALLLLGLVMVYSTSAAPLVRESGAAAALAPLVAQGGKIALGLVFYALGVWIPLRWLLRHHLVLAGIALVLLALVLVPAVGVKLNGARRWFLLGPIFFQPVEFARVAIVLFVAARVSLLGERVREFGRGVLPIGLLIGTAAVLLLLQPDFGSALFLLGLGVLLLVIGGARILHFAVAGAVVLPVCLFYAWTSLAHVGDRVAQYLEPTRDGQAFQSVLALGAGGVTGTGLGAGTAKLGYLPMISSDFILAGVGEELGFVGSSLVLLLFLLFLVLATRIVVMQRGMARFLLGAGLTLSIAVQALVNVAVVTAAVPTKGIALPFLSAGGSSLAMSLFAVGLLVNLARSAGAPGEGTPAARFAQRVQETWAALREPEEGGAHG